MPDEARGGASRWITRAGFGVSRLSTRAALRATRRAGGPAVKRRVLIGAVLWTLLISAAHVQLNVGWRGLWKSLGVLRGTERAEMVVGFLPVT